MLDLFHQNWRYFCSFLYWIYRIFFSFHRKISEKNQNKNTFPKLKRISVLGKPNTKSDLSFLYGCVIFVNIRVSQKFCNILVHAN